MKIKYPFLLATLAMLALVVCLFNVGAVSGGGALCLVALWQGAILCLDRPRPALFTTGLSASQIDEIQNVVLRIEAYGARLKDVPDRLKKLEDENDELRAQLRSLRKRSMDAIGSTGVRWIGNKAFVSDDCAESLTAVLVRELNMIPNALESLVHDAGTRQRVVDKAKGILGLATTRTAMDATTVPLPTVYVPQVIELVWKYGQARQYATVYPLGAGTVKLPRLKAGEDDFGFLGAGTAGMSQAVTERRVTAELVTFTANKMGGLIRIPTEIEEDTFIPLGQFLARYIGRQLAKLEDKTMFLADGSSTYASCTGVGPYCTANPTYLQQLAGGKTKPTDATLTDFRTMRSLINPAALVDDPAYYMHPTMESLLVTFNTIGSPLIYRPAVGSQPATLDGFPIHWVGVLQANSPVAQPSKYLAMFGSLLYWYLGERGAPRIEVSREVFFATDEIAMRALERVDVEAMGIDAMAALQTAAQ
jgi:HK97 family phage major capsid protein